MQFVDPKMLAVSMRPEEFVEVLNTERLIGAKIKLYIPIKMLEPYKDRIFAHFGRRLSSLAIHRGLTPVEAWCILNNRSVYDATEDQQREHIRDILRAIEKFNDKQESKQMLQKLTDLDMLDIPQDTQPERKAAFTTDELIYAIDVPGFCWNNLSNAEQRNLSSSLDAFVHELLAKVGKGPGPIAVYYETCYVETNPSCGDVGQQTEWVRRERHVYEDMKEQHDKKRGYLNYKFRQLAEIIDVDSKALAEKAIERIDTLFDAIAHGDEDHRAWLKEAIRAHFAEEPMPEYVEGVSSKAARIAELESQISKMPKLALLGWGIKWPEGCGVGAIRYIGADGYRVKEAISKDNPLIEFHPQWGNPDHLPKGLPEDWPMLYLNHTPNGLFP